MEISRELATFVNRLRRLVLVPLGFTAAAAAGLVFLSPFILDLLSSHLDQKLAFYQVSEPFLAHVRLAVFTALFIGMPFVCGAFVRAAAAVFGLSALQVNLFILVASVLFYSGATFCYLLTLPYGIDFLLGFQTELLKPMISVSRFVNFTAMFILGFGLIFELPVFMVFCGRTGLIGRAAFARNRRYAILFISIAAAVLTPTPDVFNMMLMAVPLYLLYESGLLVLRLMKIP